MSVRLHGIALAVSACLAAPAWAAYTQLDIPDRLDFAFDRAGVLNITSGTEVIRYDTGSASYLSSFSVPGASLIGIDLSPDGTTLAVADGTTYDAQNRIHLIETATGSTQSVNFTRSGSETGTFMVAWTAQDQLLTTSSFAGSGWVPLREYDPSNGNVRTVASVRQNTMLTPSANRRIIGLAEANSSGGPVSAFDSTAGDIVDTTSVGWFTFEVAVSRDGSQFAVPTYDGTYLYDFDQDEASFTFDRKLGQYADHGPIGAAFSPTADILFTAEYDWDDELGGVKVYDTTTWAQIATLDGYDFGWQGNGALREGRVEISPDGQWLAVSVEGGVRLYDVSTYVPEPSGLLLLSGPLLLSLRRHRRSTHAIAR